MRVIAPIPKQFEDSNGVPYANGKVTVYLHNSTSLARIYKEAEGGTLAPNPTILDSHGAWNAFVNGGTAYDYVVQDEHDNVIFSYSNVKAYGDAITTDGIFPLEFNRNGIAAGSYDPLQGGSIDLNETEDFDITQPGIYAQILQSIADGRTPVVTAGSSGKVRLYYYTSKDTQNGTVTFTCGCDGIVEMLVLHSDGTYELTSISGNVSVLNGNCDGHQIIPGSSTPTDFDCYVVEKEGEDIWIGDDKRVHAKVGWYHVDMGVYVEPVNRENFVDARATIYIGAYVGHTPSADFDWSDYASVELDLSYNHETTPAVGFDIHVENDGDVIHLSAGAPVGDYTAECLLDWFSIHRIKGAGSGGGGGGGDTPPGDCNVHVIDLQFLESTDDDLWVECVSALLDGKLLTIRIGGGGGLVCNCEQSASVPPGYTKDSFIAYLRNSPIYSTLSFFGKLDIAGLVNEGIKFTIAPTYGLRVKWMFSVMSNAGAGVSVQGNSVTLEFGSNDIFGFDYSDPDNPRTTSENLGNVLVDVQNYGIPVSLSCRNSTRQFQIKGPCYLVSATPLVLRCHSIADYYEDPDDSATSEQIPVDYHVRLTWTPDLAWTRAQGYYTIDVDHVYPLALDSRFGGPVDGGFGQ